MLKKTKRDHVVASLMASNTRDVERNIYILDEAEEEELDWGDEDEDEVEDLAAREEAERARQKAESVLLRDRTEKTMLEEVVSRWEERLNAKQPNSPEPLLQSILRLQWAREIYLLQPLNRNPPESKSSLPPPPANALPSTGSGDISPAAPEPKWSPPSPPANALPSTGSGDRSPALPEVKATSTLPADDLPSRGLGTSTSPLLKPKLSPPSPPAHPPPSEVSGVISPAAPDRKMPSPAPPVHPLSSVGSGDITPAAPQPKSPPPANAPPSRGLGMSISTPAAPPNLPLWILPPPTTNSWEPNSRYFTLIDDEWYGDDISAPVGYEYRQREGGYFRHDREPTPLPLPAATSSSDRTVIVIDDDVDAIVTDAGSADQPIAIDVDIDDDSVPMDVDPTHQGKVVVDEDLVMAEVAIDSPGQILTDDDDEEDERSLDFDVSESDMTEEQQQLAEWIKTYHVATSGLNVYHIRCQRGSERAIVKRINNDITSEAISSNLIRAAFISQYPGGFYLQARSMLPGNVPLALYLNLIPNLLYPRGKKISVTHGTLDNPSSTISQLWEEWDRFRLGMPLHRLVDDLSGTEDSRQQFYANMFRPGTWVVSTKGLYRGDTGLVVYDTLEEIDESVECLLLLIPRPTFAKNHPLNPFNQTSRPRSLSHPASDDEDDENTPSAHQSQFNLPDFEEAGFPIPVEPRIPKMTVSAKYRSGNKRPQQMMFDLNFAQDVRAQWEAACERSPKLRDVKFEARCSQQCENPMSCRHEPPYQKRFIFDGLELRGGLALVRHKIYNLKLAESIDDVILKSFVLYPNPDVLPSCLPPSRSWAFFAGEIVTYVPEGPELWDLEKGDQGVIERDGTLVCEVLFSRSQANVAVLKRHLRKTWKLGQIVELSPHTPEVVLRTREQLGYSGLSTLNNEHFTPAGQTGLITKVGLDEVSVWLTGINSICVVHPNSIREVVENADNSGLESSFQPRLSNLGGTISLKPSLLAIQKIGDPDQKTDLAELADTFISEEVNRFDLRRIDHRAPIHSPLVASSLNQMTSYLNGTIRSTLLGYLATEGTVPRTEYTGRIPWLHVEVKPITGERKGYLARVLNVKSEWKNTKSGLLVLIRFQTPSLTGNIEDWYDYDQLRRVDNGGFIHESTFTKKISSYFNFRMGYKPRHPENEPRVTDLLLESADGSRTPKRHWTDIDYGVPAWDPGSRTPNPSASTSSASAPPPAKHWILDPRICQGLGGRDIWVNVRSEKDPVRVSLHVGSSGEVVISAQDNHVGGAKVNVATREVDPKAVLSNPRCSKVMKGHSASGLYIICEGEHTGKLVRRANYFAEQNLWVLQVMRPVFHPDRRKQFSVEIEDSDPVLKRIPGSALAMVHESRSDSESGNKMMCIVRKAAGGNTNGYDVDGHGRIVKLGHN
ncbi:hypothetical protein FB446DRAFT_709632 [Lentinula raphanica]|nr:hypothetical protein FB446DRAFT_709632 [Lentinula raphanica]